MAGTGRAQPKSKTKRMSENDRILSALRKSSREARRRAEIYKTPFIVRGRNP